MNREEMIQEYARNIIEVGLAIKEGELLHINCPVCAHEFARAVAKIAYDRGAKRVHISYRDDYVNREFYLHADIDNVKTFYEYEIEEAKYLVSEKAALLSIVSPIPKIMEGIDPKKMQERSRASNEKFSFYREYSMSNKGKWCVVAFPNQLWADQVFDNKENSYDLLFDAIIKACRIGEDKNALMDHMKELEAHKDILNDLNLKSLIFKNSLGTDLKVDLVDDHIWGGGGEFSQSGEYFLPNIPTEEVFTMPHSHGVNGRVYSTKPLNYQGKIINDFYLDFKDGAVVSYHAEENEDYFCIIIAAISGFNTYVSSYGNECGDEILKYVSNIFIRGINKDDMIFRYKKDKIFIILNNKLDVAENVAIRIVKQIESEVFIYRDNEINLTMSTGISAYADGAVAKVMIEEAENELNM